MVFIEVITTVNSDLKNTKNYAVAFDANYVITPGSEDERKIVKYIIDNRDSENVVQLHTRTTGSVEHPGTGAKNVW